VTSATRPSAPVPATVAGDLSATGRSATGIRTRVGPVRVTKPLANCVSGASVRVNVNATGTSCPTDVMVTDGLSVVTVKPGTSTATFHVPVRRPVNVRVIAVVAATWPWPSAE
jgi:hypothetical protein